VVNSVVDRKIYLNRRNNEETATGPRGWRSALSTRLPFRVIEPNRPIETSIDEDIYRWNATAQAVSTGSGATLPQANRRRSTARNCVGDGRTAQFISFSYAINRRRSDFPTTSGARACLSRQSDSFPTFAN